MTHKHCKHELDFCDHCDTVTCKKCGEEWGKAKPCQLNHYYYLQPYYPPNWIGYTVTWSSSTNPAIYSLS